MSTFIGTVALFSFDFAPPGWLLCDGTLLTIAQNQALFAVIGTTYGGNGVTDFAIPNLPGIKNEGNPGTVNYFIAIQGS